MRTRVSAGCISREWTLYRPPCATHITRAVEQQLEATTHRMSEGLMGRNLFKWKYEDCFVAAVDVRLIWRCAFFENLRPSQNDFDSLDAELTTTVQRS